MRPKAETNQRDSLTVDISTAERVIEDGSDDVLPIGADRLALLGEDPSLAGTVEREHVVAAGERGRPIREIQLLDRPVIAAGQNHGRPPAAIRSRQRESSRAA